MKPARITMGDGVEALAIPGVGVVIPGRDAQQRVIIGQLLLLLPGFPPMPIKESFDSLEEKFGEPKSKLTLA
jgi:hypothetical protein